MNNELYHHGVLGMKWGVRRYQNADGTLTAEGKRKYGTQEHFDAKQRFKNLTRDRNLNPDGTLNEKGIRKAEKYRKGNIEALNYAVEQEKQRRKDLASNLEDIKKNGRDSQAYRNSVADRLKNTENFEDYKNKSLDIYKQERSTLKKMQSDAQYKLDSSTNDIRRIKSEINRYNKMPASQLYQMRKNDLRTIKVTIGAYAGLTLGALYLYSR